MRRIFKKEHFLYLCGVISVFISALSIRLMLFFNTSNYFPKWEDISAAKILEAKLPETFLEIASAVLPLYPLLLRFIGLYLDDYLFFAPLVSVCCGVLSTVILFLLLKKVFGLEVAFFSSLLFCFYPIHLIQSVLATEMTLFALIVLLLFCSYYFYLDHRRKWAFFYLCVFMNVLALIRPEGWVLGVVVVFCLAVNVSFRVSLCCFLLGNIVFCYNLFKGKIYDYAISQHHVSTLELSSMVEANQLDDNIFSIWVELMRAISPLFVLVVGVFGLLCFFKVKRYLLWYASFFSLFMLFFYRISTFSMHPHPRYFSLLFLFFVPFVFLAFVRVIASLKLRLFVESCFLLVAIGAFLGFNICMYNDTLPSPMEVLRNPISQPSEVVLAADWIKGNVGDGASVLVDHPKNPRFFLAVATLLGGKKVDMAFILPEMLEKAHGDFFLLKKKIFFLKPDFILVYDDGFFLEVCDNFKVVKSLGEGTYIKRFSAANFSIWEAEKK